MQGANPISVCEISSLMTPAMLEAAGLQILNFSPEWESLDERVIALLADLFSAADSTKRNESPRVSWRPVGLSQADMTA